MRIRFCLTDVRIRRLTEEKNELCDQLRRVKLDLEEERTKSMFRERPVSVSTPASPNGPVGGDLPEWQSKNLNAFCTCLIMGIHSDVIIW